MNYGAGTAKVVACTSWRRKDRIPRAFRGSSGANGEKLKPTGPSHLAYAESGSGMFRSSSNVAIAFRTSSIAGNSLKIMPLIAA